MKQIWKFPLAKHIGAGQMIKMPKGAEIISAQNQNEEYCIWAWVNADAERVPRVFEILMTGPSYPTDNIERIHLSTQQFADGLVQHLFERIG